MAEAMTSEGYGTAAYAASLSEYGIPRSLRECDGWFLDRPTPDGSTRDGMGCYPLFCCTHWLGLEKDIDNLRESGLVSFCAVLDPFGEHDAVMRERCFPDRLIAFKEHYVTDLAAGPNESIVSAHHRHDARRALRRLRIDLCVNPTVLLDDWWTLYGQLCMRHEVSGIAVFSRDLFARQMVVPGMVVFAAWDGLALAGMSLWCHAGDVAYYHLNACNNDGYRSGASYALMWVALEHWRVNGVRWASLGAGSGLKGGSGGLEFFKQGWSTGTRTAWFGGVIFQREIYDRLSRGANGTSFFPAYRRPDGTLRL